MLREPLLDRGRPHGRTGRRRGHDLDHNDDTVGLSGWPRAVPDGESRSWMRVLRRFAVTLVGAALLLVGGAMTVLPGPGILFVLAGLAVLATEYVWARSLLAHARRHAERVQEAA